MATINEIIEKVDKTKPNVFDENQKAEWIYRLDGRISREIFNETPPQQYIYPEDGDKELLVPHPYDDIYVFYLQALIDYSNEEYNKYNNAITMYNEAFASFAKLYQRENMPKASGGFKNVI